MPRAEQDEPGEKRARLDHGDIVGHHRRAAEKRRHGDDRGPRGRQDQRSPADRQRARRAVEAPQHAGKGDEPHEHRQVHVRDQRDEEEIGDRKQPREPRRARQHQQDREDAGGRQRGHAQREPALRQPHPAIARQRERVASERECEVEARDRRSLQGVHRDRCYSEKFRRATAQSRRSPG